MVFPVLVAGSVIDYLSGGTTIYDNAKSEWLAADR